MNEYLEGFKAASIRIKYWQTGKATARIIQVEREHYLNGIEKSIWVEGYVDGLCSSVGA